MADSESGLGLGREWPRTSRGFIELVRRSLEPEDIPEVPGKNVPGYVALLYDTFLNVPFSDKGSAKQQMADLMRVLQSHEETAGLVAAVDEAINNLEHEQPKKALRLRYNLDSPGKESLTTYEDIGIALGNLSRSRADQILGRGQQNLRSASQIKPIYEIFQTG
ncbi:MAG: hypothetical protein A2784_02685 [Candidatus Chisholmbacteria bacterium RIFCSPHIGHO2_01_FULL_48_12]|uniref:Uncharacterized protein n=1 Tax=Candidatus Chisholmbacteria bacterium RIFCSPHIGHO2_01_FULL_48_12 TaxID=1797589 RepID=A0A1G1VM84_9BACT|nr:MAG: hypothetical protein A2784_02685 [Candidatus Chisholmbacteria bacterium RIFCSPHIGHO2_01_FULL_48_12]